MSPLKSYTALRWDVEYSSLNSNKPATVIHRRKTRDDARKIKKFVSSFPQLYANVKLYRVYCVFDEDGECTFSVKTKSS